MKKNVVYLTNIQNSFSEHYIAIREKEKRILTDNEVLNLPKLSSKNPNSKEWELREASCIKIIKNLQLKNKPLEILDIGCGNGWFTNSLAKIEACNIYGIDINKEELEQANRAFQKDNLQFIFGDIFEINSEFENKFDIITLNASIQYFPDLKLLFSKLNTFLKYSGEIHILDSHFYNNNEVIEAKKRTDLYYSEMGFPEMSNYYFHHKLSDLEHFIELYKPHKSIINKVLGKKDSPFTYFKYIKNT